MSQFTQILIWPIHISLNLAILLISISKPVYAYFDFWYKISRCEAKTEVYLHQLLCAVYSFTKGKVLTRETQLTYPYILVLWVQSQKSAFGTDFRFLIEIKFRLRSRHLGMARHGDRLRRHTPSSCSGRRTAPSASRQIRTWWTRSRFDPRRRPVQKWP